MAREEWTRDDASEVERELVIYKSSWGWADENVKHVDWIINFARSISRHGKTTPLWISDAQEVQVNPSRALDGIIHQLTRCLTVKTEMGGACNAITWHASCTSAIVHLRFRPSVSWWRQKDYLHFFSLESLQSCEIYWFLARLYFLW